MGSAVAAFERYTALGEESQYAGLGRRVRPAPSAGEGSAIRVLDGLARIQAAMDEATQACTTEVLTGPARRHPPRGRAHRGPAPGAGAARPGRADARPVHPCGPARSGAADYLELMGGAVEARTLDEVIDRLILFDRTVAFIPANTDRTLALELRHPALVEYLVTVFERLWRLAIPLTDPRRRARGRAAPRIDRAAPASPEVPAPCGRPPRQSGNSLTGAGPSRSRASAIGIVPGLAEGITPSPARCLAKGGAARRPAEGRIAALVLRPQAVHDETARVEEAEH